MTPKQDLLDRASHEYRAFRAAIDDLTDAELTEVWLGTWSVRDIVAHIVGWQRELRPALERVTQGERPIPKGVSYDNFDEWNQKFAAAMRDTPARQVLRALAESHEAFLGAAAAVPEERFRPERTAYKIVDLNSAHHYREHGGEIRAWRQSAGR